MGYYIDLKKISLEQYHQKLSISYLPPSRMMLKERTEERFRHFRDKGINNVKELLQFLKKQNNFDELRKIECFSGDYLTILLREIKSIQPKPNRISDFSVITKDTVIRLGKIGITNTEKSYPKILTTQSRDELASQTGISTEEILQLTKLTDISRMKWVGVLFAQILFETGFDTVNKIKFADSVELHKRVNTLIKEKQIYKGQIGLNDIRILIDVAGDLDDEVEYGE